MSQIIKIRRTTNVEAETALEFGEQALVNPAPGVADLYIGGSNGEIISIAGSNKMNKVSGSTANNILTVNATGQAIDSGYSVETTVSGSSTKIPTSSAVLASIQASQQGLSVKQSVLAATTAPLATVVAAGSGATKTLTASANGLLSIDGISTWVDVTTDNGSIVPEDLSATPASRVLVKNQANAVDNGIYVVTDKGSASTLFVLTRALDANNALDLNNGAFVFVQSGTVNSGSGFVLTTVDAVIDTSGLNFTQFSGAGSIIAGTGLEKTGNTLFIANGGVTATQIATNTILNSNLTQANAKTWKGNNTIALADVSDNSAGSLTETTSSVLTITGGASALLNSASIEVKQATTSQSGFLLNTDWNTFNNKVSIDAVQTLSATGSITAWNSTVYVSGTSNITLPTPTGNAGKKLTIKKTDTGTITTILPASGLIDGGASFEMSYQHDSITIESNGTNYFIIASHSNTIDGGVF